MADELIEALDHPALFGPIAAMIEQVRGMIPSVDELRDDPNFSVPGPFVPVPAIYVHILAQEIERLAAEILRLEGIVAGLSLEPQGTA